MGIIKRLKRITTSRIDAFLDALENPEAIYPELLKELKEQVRVAQQAEAKAQTALNGAQRKVDELNGRRARMEQGARNALSQQDEATSRDALRAQLESEEQLEEAGRQLERTEKAYLQAREARLQLEAELTRLEEDKDAILDRARTAETKEKLDAVSDDGANSLLSQIAHFAGKVKDIATGIDTEARAREDLENESLDARLRRLEKDAEIDKRLQQMKDEPGN